MEVSSVAGNAPIAEALDPRVATIIAVTFVVLIFAIPIASVLISTFANSLVVFLATCLLSVAGLLISLYPHPAAIPAGIGI